MTVQLHDEGVHLEEHGEQQGATARRGVANAAGEHRVAQLLRQAGVQ
jgi:hypothetical protein